LSESTANPAPLGLLGFGMTTILLNLHNAGLFPLNAMIIAMGLFYGGLAQVIAGIMEWKKGNTFGLTAFTSYGLFWLSLSTLLVLPELGLAEAPGATAMTAYLLAWGLFTAAMFVGTLKLNKGLQFVFGSLTVLFFLLALADATGDPFIKTVAGVEGIVCGASAAYVGLAQVLNDFYGKNKFPI
jgi:uncharacterized protein